MPIIIFLLIFLLGIFIYSWYELRSSLKLSVFLKKPILNKGIKLIKKIITSSDGMKISTWYVPSKNPKAVVILVHGYNGRKGENEGKASMLKHAKYFNEAKYSTILIDLRSWGKNIGTKVTLGVNEYKDVEAAYDYAKSLPENKGKKIGFLGKSMGGVTSIITKGITGKGDFVIALTPYASFSSLFSFRIKQKGFYSPFFLPFVKLAAFFELGFNYETFAPINLIKKIDVPIFIVAANKDESVSRTDGKYLFDNANFPKEFWQADTAHDIFKENPLEFKKKVLSFLSKYT